MSKKQKDQTITIDDKEYKIADLTQEQVAMVNHVSDLGNKLKSMNFNREQLQFGYDAFVKTLKESLENEQKVN